ncbi:hypothetical protein VCRA2113O326_80195 [Vibrio crassostreae]|nr:hypothetical protein VCRA2113O326_80195 [Vibrio crassostreae]
MNSIPVDSVSLSLKDITPPLSYCVNIQQYGAGESIFKQIETSITLNRVMSTHP